jgi:carbamoylphosphate synthase small subunit
VYKDIRQVREHYAALRDLIAQRLGGRDDVATRSQVTVLCEAAIAALDDSETRQRLRAVERHAAELFSDDQHQKWSREHMSGADYLRLQLFIALEAVNTRLFFLETLRDRGRQQGAVAPRTPAV